jgi:hypothetical protein
MSPNRSWVTISLASEASALPATKLNSIIPYFKFVLIFNKVDLKKAQYFF